MENRIETLTRLEKDLGLPSGFCVRLKEEKDDWSFIIKTHALLEGATAEQLTRALGRNELSDVFSELPMSDPKKGKAAFLRKLRLLPDPHVVFIQELSQLRNQCAHKVQNVSIDLADHFETKSASLNPKQLRNFANRWAFGVKCPRGERDPYPPESLAYRSYIVPEEETPGAVQWTRATYLLAYPKTTLWYSAMAVLENIAFCNWYGPQVWPFLMELHPDEQKEYEDWVLEIYERATPGDGGVPLRIAEKYERLHPGVRIQRDADGQPDLLSFAAARWQEQRRINKELAEED